jgi:hypothetical protein
LNAITNLLIVLIFNLYTHLFDVLQRVENSLIRTQTSKQETFFYLVGKISVLLYSHAFQTVLNTIALCGRNEDQTFRYQ